MSYEDAPGVLRVVAVRNREVTHWRWLITKVGLGQNYSPTVGEN
jgi:hypothetical protein